MMKIAKLLLVSTVLIFLVAGVTALAYGYTHVNGSEVYFDNQGNIAGVDDALLLQCRSPTQREIQTNDYVPMQSLATCLSEKGVVLYYTETCPHCHRQLEMFGNQRYLLNTVECSEEPSECENIQAVPTWKINGKYYRGVIELNKLMELSGCN